MRLKYILKRILVAIPTFFGITILAYFILNLAPGSPLDALLADPGITPAELERKRVALGLDQPVIVQYFTWLKQLLTGNLGFSYSTQRPVATMILERLPATAILAASSILLSLVVSIPLGIFAASKPNSKRDYFSGGLSMQRPTSLLAWYLFTCLLLYSRFCHLAECTVPAEHVPLEI